MIFPGRASCPSLAGGACDEDENLMFKASGSRGVMGPLYE